MIAHAEAVFRLGRRRQDGTTERDHLLAYQAATGTTPPELELPPIPAGAEMLWRTFQELSGARMPGGFGAANLTLQDIAAWQSLMRVRLTPWEVETILAIDRAALAALNEKAADK